MRRYILLLLVQISLTSSGQVHRPEKSFYPVYAIYPHLLDTATNTEYVYDENGILVCALAVIDTTQLYRRVTYYFANKNKSWEYSEKYNRRCDTTRSWTENGILQYMEIYSDTGYTVLDFSYESGRILQVGNYMYSKDSGASVTIRDSATFETYESAPCSSDCLQRCGPWFTFYENGQLESEGKYLPNVFMIDYPTKDSAGIAVIVRRSGFEDNQYTMGIRCSTYLKDGTWKYYNENGKEIGEEYYDGGFLKSKTGY